MAQENKNYYYDRNGYNTYGVRGTATAGGTTVEKFEMTETEGVTYSASTGATIVGSAEINDTDSVDVELIVPIKAGEGLVVDADDQDESIEVHLDSTVTGKLSRALLTPLSTPIREQLVSVDLNNSQEMLNLGLGLNKLGGALNVYGTGYITTAPTENNIDGDMKFVVLSSEPATYYDGFYYIITGA